MTHEFDFGSRTPSWEQPAPPPWRPARPSVPTSKELLEAYAQKPVRRFYQVDGWYDPDGFGLCEPDEDGHVITGGERYELRTSDFPIRVYINQDSEPALVAALLRKVIEWVESDWHTISGAEYADTPSPIARRTGNVIEVDFSQVATQGPSLTWYDETGCLHSVVQPPPWGPSEDQRLRYDDFDLPF